MNQQTNEKKVTDLTCKSEACASLEEQARGGHGVLRCDKKGFVGGPKGVLGAKGSGNGRFAFFG